MRSCPQFSFCILIALVKICFFHISHKPRKNTSVLVGKFLKKPEYLGPTVRFSKSPEKVFSPEEPLLKIHYILCTLKLFLELWLLNFL